MHLVLEHLLASPSRVDRTARVIRGVKVLGLVSANTGRTLGLDPREYGQAVDRPYRYSTDAMRDAIPLYEGIAVNIDHPPAGVDASGRRLVHAAGRSTGDRFGRLINVRLSETGLVADLEYLAAHPLAEMVVETAERMPEQLALSHHARCEFALADGQIVARRIVAVQSVDIIADPPGTTTSLFESSPSTQELRVSRRTLKDLAESLSADTPGADPLRRILHDGLVPPDLDVEFTDDEPVNDLARIAAAFHATLRNAADQPDLPTACRRVSELVEAWHAPDDRTVPDVAALRRENAHLKACERARQLIDDAGLPPTSALIKAVAALESHNDQDELLRSLTHSSLVRPALATRPRSSEPLFETFAEAFPRPNGPALAQLLRSPS